jgi:hypothetical protein
MFCSSTLSVGVHHVYSSLVDLPRLVVESDVDFFCIQHVYKKLLICFLSPCETSFRNA